METKNELTAENLIGETEVEQQIGQRKKSIKNFFFEWIKDDYNKIFLLVLIAAFIIRIIIFVKTQNQALWWDAADYMATGKRWSGVNENLIDIWYYRRGFLWALIASLFFKIGLGELGMRFLVVLLSTGIIFVSYLLIGEMFNKKFALLTSLALSFSWIFIFFTGRLLTEIPATFFLLTSLLFFWKGFVKNQKTSNFVFFGIFAALTILIRMQYLMFAIPIFIFALIKEKHKIFVNKKLWLAIIIFLVILIPHIYIYNKHFGNPILDLANYYLGVEGLSKSGEVGVELAKTSDLFLYINNLPYILDANQKGYNTLSTISPLYILFIIGFFLFFIDLIIGIDKIFQNSELQKKTFIFIFLLTLIIIGYMAPQLEQRYIMPTLPFLFFLSVYPLIFLNNYITRKSNIESKTIIILLAIILLLILIPNYKFGFNLIESKKLSYYEIKQSGLWINENSNLEDIIIAGSLPQLTYYSERSVYPFDLAYRRDLPNLNETDLDKFILENKPKYFILSIHESQEPWVFNYPEKHKDLLTPVQFYGPQNNPTLIIYEFNYT